MYTGFRGYEDTISRNEGALSGQMALDRLALELRDLDYFRSAMVDDSSLEYRSKSMAGDRVLKYESNKIIIEIDNTDYTLLEAITDNSFHLSSSPKDLDGDGVDDVEYIEVSFRLDNIDKEFRTRIFPRHMVADK
jgi:hypothetical protein